MVYSTIVIINGVYKYQLACSEHIVCALVFFFSPHIGFHLSIHLSVHIFCSFCHIFCKQQTPAPASLQLLENPKARKLFALLTVMAAAAASTLLLLLPQQPELLFTSLSLAYVLCHVGIVDSPESLHFMFGSENKHVLRFSM